MIRSTIVIPYSNSNNGYFKTTNITNLIIKNNLLNLINTKLKLLIFDCDFGINILQFVFDTFLYTEMLLKINKHISTKVNKYIPLIKTINCYIDLNRSDINSYMIFFLMRYVLKSTSLIIDILFIYDNGVIIING